LKRSKSKDILRHDVEGQKMKRERKRRKRKEKKSSGAGRNPQETAL